MIGDQAENWDVPDRTRERFLEDVASSELSQIGNNAALVVVTHLLPDRPVLLDVLSRHVRIQHVFAIPYSTDRRVADWTKGRFQLSEPTLGQLIQGTCIVEQLRASKCPKTILVEIGGYSSTALNLASAPTSFCGVVEGTESGLAAHRRFDPLDYPVIALSLSPTKAAESNLVGPGCIVSTMRLLRELGYSNELRTACVLGFGRVGSSVSRAARAVGFDVVVYDRDGDKRLQALGEGFRIPGRIEAIEAGEIVFGATGEHARSPEDIRATQDGAFLVSCSSKDVEFDFSTLRARYETIRLSDAAHRLVINDKHINVLYEGRPVNFRDGAPVGALLTLLQAEMIGSCADLLVGRVGTGIYGPSDALRERLTSMWEARHIDPVTGWYRKRFGGSG